MSGLLEQALVMITVEPSREEEVIAKLKTLKHVVEVHFLYGPYDVYVKVAAPTAEELQELVLGEIRMIKGVKSTMTCFIAD